MTDHSTTIEAAVRLAAEHGTDDRERPTLTDCPPERRIDPATVPVTWEDFRS